MLQCEMGFHGTPRETPDRSVGSPIPKPWPFPLPVSLTSDQQLVAWQNAVETAPDGEVTAAMTMIHGYNDRGFHGEK
jgi:hypothetical protein